MSTTGSLPADLLSAVPGYLYQRPGLFARDYTTFNVVDELVAFRVEPGSSGYMSITT